MTSLHRLMGNVATPGSTRSRTRCSARRESVTLSSRATSSAEATRTRRTPASIADTEFVRSICCCRAGSGHGGHSSGKYHRRAASTGTSRPSPLVTRWAMERQRKPCSQRKLHQGKRLWPGGTGQQIVLAVTEQGSETRPRAWSRRFRLSRGRRRRPARRSRAGRPERASASAFDHRFEQPFGGLTDRFWFEELLDAIGTKFWPNPD